jgi:hypothetical protein
MKAVTPETETVQVAGPPVENTRQELSTHGIKTVYYNVHHPVTANATDSNLVPIADEVAAKDRQLVVLGTVDVPSLLAFVHAFEAYGFTPKMFIASSGRTGVRGSCTTSPRPMRRR